MFMTAARRRPPAGSVAPAGGARPCRMVGAGRRGSRTTWTVALMTDLPAGPSGQLEAGCLAPVSSCARPTDACPAATAGGRRGEMLFPAQERSRSARRVRPQPRWRRRGAGCQHDLLHRGHRLQGMTDGIAPDSSGRMAVTARYGFATPQPTCGSGNKPRRWSAVSSRRRLTGRAVSRGSSRPGPAPRRSDEGSGVARAVVEHSARHQPGSDSRSSSPERRDPQRYQPPRTGALAVLADRARRR